MSCAARSGEASVTLQNRRRPLAGDGDGEPVPHRAATRTYAQEVADAKRREELLEGQAASVLQVGVVEHRADRGLVRREAQYAHRLAELVEIDGAVAVLLGGGGPAVTARGRRATRRASALAHLVELFERLAHRAERRSHFRELQDDAVELGRVQHAVLAPRQHLGALEPQHELQALLKLGARVLRPVPRTVRGPLSRRARRAAAVTHVRAARCCPRDDGGACERKLMPLRSPRICITSDFT